MGYVRLMLLAVLLSSGALFAQQASSSSADQNAPESSNGTTVRGCLQGERGNYIVVEDKTGSIFVLKGVGNKLDDYLRHEVEVKGKLLSGTVKTGVRSEKAGSNPADTVHGVDGVPLQVANPRTDVRTISKKCKAADQE
ncbi:MAG TPA: hypothetical protein VEI26_06910 [Terriglobales bacterium]|nr:hypothetical protein [Terriglobales bacterium]